MFVYRARPRHELEILHRAPTVTSQGLSLVFVHGADRKSTRLNSSH